MISGPLQKGWNWERGEDLGFKIMLGFKKKRKIIQGK